MGKIRIIGGVHRSRMLPVLDSEGLRPTLDRVKETLFNWLGQDLTGRSCLDLFAGSGSLGFEALSRNARDVVMVEKDSKVASQLKTNAQMLKTVNCRILNQSALDFLEKSQLGFDVVFLDPPYQTNLLNESLALVKRALNPGGRIFIEYVTKPDLAGFTIVKEGKAGNVKYALLKWDSGL